MLFGNKKEFGIEFEVKEIYHNKFIGDGFFVVYIDGFMYGIREDDATSFNAILGTLRYLRNSIFHEKNTFNNYDDFELCDKYYDIYRDIRHYTDDEIKDFIDSYEIRNKKRSEVFLEYWNPMEEAFDNGCFVLQVNEVECVRLLGFNTLSDGSYDIKDVHGVKISKGDFFLILNSVIDEMERYRNV